MKTFFEVQTYTLCDGWVNTWQDEDGTPVVFTTEVAALAELNEFLHDVESAYINGHLDAPYDACEYRVTKLGVQP